MIVHNLHVVGVAFVPDKANPPLVVDSNAVLSLPITFQRLQAISRRGSQVTEFNGRIQLAQLPKRHSLKASEASDRFAPV
jgi:hypothetical protein